MTLRALSSDIRYALRTFARAPMFTVIAVATLAVGIGLNTAVFSVVHAVLLEPLPFPNADRLVTIWEHGKRTDRNSVSPANFLDWKAQNRVFADIAAIADQRMTLRGAGDPVHVEAQSVTVSLFPILGLQPAQGRTFTEAEGRREAPNVAVISYGLWQRRFGGNPKLIGGAINLDDETYTVVGIMPPQFQSMEGLFNKNSEIWTPMRLDPARDYRKASGRYMVALGRLKDGVTLEEARAEMTAIAARLEQTYPAFNKGWRVNLVPWHTAQTSDVRPALVMLAAGVGMVLLIACANVANLLIVRASGRRREIAIRTAVGADRRRIVQQLLTESILLSVIGALGGLALAARGIPLLLSLSPKDLPRTADIGMNSAVLLFTLATACITGALFGLAPAFQASRLSVNDALRAGAQNIAGSRQRFRNLLIVGELALSVVLLVGAALLVQSFMRLRAVDPGFRPDHLLTMAVGRSGNNARTDAQVTAYFREAIYKLRQLPGIESASAITFLPLDGLGSATGFTIEGQPAPEPGKVPTCDVRMVSDGYFQTMGVPIIRGRDFNDREASSEAEPLRFVISRSMADQYWPGENPIGKKITVAMKRTNVPGEIIGIVGDIRHYGLDAAPRPTVYYPQAQLQIPFMTFVARTAGDAAAAAPAVISTIRQMDPAQPLGEALPMDHYLANSMAKGRFEMVLLSVFAAIALLLASIGLYGVLSTLVAQRVPELGVRMALGATSANIFRLIVVRCLGLTVAGICTGVAAALMASRVASSLLYSIKPTDPMTYAVVATLLLVVSMLASYIPARRAMRVDPITALRYE